MLQYELRLPDLKANKKKRNPSHIYPSLILEFFVLISLRVNTRKEVSTKSISDKSNQLREVLKKKILVLDGAMGTAIQEKNLSAEDFGGATLDSCNENLVITRPEIISKIHVEHLKAGCDIIETNTFGGTPFVLDEFGIGSKCYEINFQASKIARKTADQYSTKDKPRFVAGSIGPTTKAISVTGGITFENLKNAFYTQITGLMDGNVDYLLIETCQDTRNIKAALLAADQAFEKKGFSIPIAISGTIEPMGTMLAGQSVEALLTSLEHRDLLYLGLNCATGPEFMTDHLRSLSALSSFPIACVPNAGLPDEDGNYLENPKMIADTLAGFINNGWVNLIGGCCGTTSAHIKALSEIANGKPPRSLQKNSRSTLSGVDYLEITDELRPVIVGERTNVIGSRKFKRLLCEGSLDEAAEIAKTQIKKGAQIIDVCVANPDREELEDMRNFLEAMIQKIRAPLMIDSTDSKVIELALTYSQGKAIINSINLEDGEERFEQVVPLGKKYGAAFVVGTIDDHPKQGMGVSRERKLEIATREYELLTKKYGVHEEDIYWDPLVFPCATGDQQYTGSALETIEGIRLIKKKYPKTKTILGISNVSFGLPSSGREVLNSVFLYHCVQAGLDLAIVNSEKLERYASIPEEEKKLADDLLYNRGEDPIQAFANHFRGRESKPKVEKSNLTLDERLASYIIEGSKDGLKEDLELKRKDTKPLNIINGPLMAGMDTVGKLFNTNKLIVAEVLQSAEAMKAAVAHLEPFMDKNASKTRGKIILATVKGDVHDIGKNLVDIILTNNGFEVINLGIKVLPETLIQEAQKHKPDIIGLSGLLVKSAQQMVLTADDFSKAGIKTKMLVGGAALSENFVDRKIAPAYLGTVSYATDAMNGLDQAKTMVDKESFSEFKQALEAKRKEKEKNRISSITPKKEKPISTRRSNQVRILPHPPIPPDFKRHVLKHTPIQSIWKYINPFMLYGRHLGIKGKTIRQLEATRDDPKLRAKCDPKALKIWDQVEKIKEEYKQSALMKPKAVFQFFKAMSDGNDLHLFKDPFKKVVFNLPRQSKAPGLCLSDYVWPKETTQDDCFDNICVFATTVGVGIRDQAESLTKKGDYLKSHIIQALAIESAEGYAELLHSDIRRLWGLADPKDITMMQRFQAKYTGKRYSPGYPACPRLDDQAKIFELISPEAIDIELTDGFMMDPEASVTAFVFHHPDAVYFSATTSIEIENRMG